MTKRPINRLDMRPTWHLRHVERWRNMSYADMARQMSQRLDLVEPYTLAIDLTGGAAPRWRNSRDRGPTASQVSIHGSDRVSYADGG